MKWMCRNTFAALFRPYVRKAWVGDVPVSEALSKCACYGVREGGRWVYAVAVQIRATMAHIWAAVGTSGDNWAERTNEAMRHLCKGHHVTFVTKRPGIAGSMPGWFMRPFDAGMWKVWRAF